MKRFLALVCASSLPLLCSFCHKPPSSSANNAKVSEIVMSDSISQGICGTVYFKRGNQMPSPDRPISKGKPVVREIFVYELTNSAQLNFQGRFVQQIPGQLVAKVQSNAKGEYCVALPEGSYSLFIKEEGKGFFTNIYDGEGNVHPIRVEKGKVTKDIFTINYAATY